MSALATDIVVTAPRSSAGTGGRFFLLPTLLALGLSACAAPHARPAGNSGASASGPSRQLSPGEIASLATLTGTELTARLGKPDFQRRDPPAELWQYRSAACVLNVFLYPQADGALKVSYVRAQDPRQVHAAANGCSPFSPPSPALSQMASLP